MTQIPPADEKGIAIIEGEFRDIAPTLNATQARDAMKLYQEIAQAVTDSEDYQTFKDKKTGRDHVFRKRSGWKKLERFYGVSVAIRDERMFHQHQPSLCLRVKMPEHYKDVIDCGCPIKGVRYIVRAVDVRSGRYSENTGTCVITEARVSQNASLHDLATRAFNRGANRAVADLIGVSDPSAEEKQAEPDAGFSQEERVQLRDTWKAAREDDQMVAIAHMRDMGYAGETTKDVYTDFLRRGTEEDMENVLVILRGPSETFDPDDVPIDDAAPASAPEPEPAKTKKK